MAVLRGRRGVIAAVLSLLLVVGALGALILARLLVSDPFGGTSITERDLSRAEQLAPIDQFSPVPTPAEATDIRLTYQRFQDWSFDASFTLPADALDRYTAALEPAATPDPQAIAGSRYRGRRIGAFEGWVEVDRASGRVRVRHVSS